MPTLHPLGGPRQGENDDSPTSLTAEEHEDIVAMLKNAIEIQEAILRQRQQILQDTHRLLKRRLLDVDRLLDAVESKGGDKVANDIKNQKAGSKLEAVAEDDQQGKDATEDLGEAGDGAMLHTAVLSRIAGAFAWLLPKWRLKSGRQPETES